MNMDPEILEKYLKAGKAVAKALKLAEKIVRPGAKYIDVATLVEGHIIENGCELAFPINMSLNEQAAHYSPIIDDPLVIPDNGLLKVDCGAHCDGYIADAAITINLGNDSGLFQKLIDSSKVALDRAVKNARPGVDVRDLGRIIHATINQYGLKPVANLGGHGLEKFNLHAGVFIPNTPSAGNPYKLEVGKAYACEPFSTNGAGIIKNGPLITIFQLKAKKTKKMNIYDKNLVNKFKEKFKTLPFSPRAIDFIKNKDEINKVVSIFHRKGILYGYNVFIEATKGFVAQSEHTFIVNQNETIITTTLEN
ncbi:MAG: type II methionyl aminopeptidase [Promethearchaeota archaeon]